MSFICSWQISLSILYILKKWATLLRNFSLQSDEYYYHEYSIWHIYIPSHIEMFYDNRTSYIIIMFILRSIILHSFHLKLSFVFIYTFIAYKFPCTECIVIASGNRVILAATNDSIVLDHDYFIWILKGWEVMLIS